ncbi:pertactin-like passenger domain-containing protein, partial [Yoonia sp. R2-816]
MTKFKGRVASIAPGLSVVATAAVLCTGSAAQAACTEDASTGVATCPATTYASGIVYSGDVVHTLTLPADPGLNVLGWGVDVDYGGDENVFVHMRNGTVNATNNHGNNHGVSARTTGTGSVDARLSGDGEITINHSGSGALRARIDNGNVDIATRNEADATAVMDGGKITITGGNFNEGVSAFTSGFGNAIAKMSDGLVVTEAGRGETFAVNASVHNNRADYEGQAAALMTGGEIQTRNFQGVGVRATTRATTRNTTQEAEAFVHMSGGKITTYGEAVVINGETKSGSAHALSAAMASNKDSVAKVMALMTGGEIETIRNNSSGVRAFNNGLGNATAEMDEKDDRNSTITTHGNQSHGLQAFAIPSDNQTTADGRAAAAGVAEAKMSAGTIIINGQNAHGMYAQANGVLGTALVRMDGGSITTTADNASAIYARIDNQNHTNNSDNTNGVKVIMTRGSIRTENLPDAFHGSHGIHVDTNGSGDLTVDMEGGSITTVGKNSHGIWAESEGASDAANESRAKAIVKLGTHARVEAKGSGSDGILVSGNVVDGVLLGARGFDIDVAGSVTGGSGGGDAAIRTISSDRGTIVITSTATVAASAGSGIAIQTHTAGFSGSVKPEDDGTATITSEGTIIGDIRLDAGDDTLIVTDGSITGDVYGSQGDNTLSLGGRRFTGDIRLVGGDNILEIEDGSFAGGIYGGESDDTVTIFAASTYDGSHVLDGGGGNNDRLTLHGKTISNTTDNFLNWESVTLNATTLSLSGVTTVDMDLSIDAGSAFRAFGGKGGMTIAGPKVTNEGSVVFSVQDGSTGDEIRVEGDYTGSGTSLFALDARMDGTGNDRLHFTGDMSGDMEVLIASVGNAGATGGPLEIYVVSVDGEADDATFTLMDGNYVMADGEHGVISGAHLYRLAEVEVEAQDGGSSTWWALSARSESGEVTYQPSAPLYDSYGAALLAFNAPSGLHERGSSQDFRNLAWGGAGADTPSDAADQDTGSPLWIQMGTEQLTASEEHSTTGAALE